MTVADRAQEANEYMKSKMLFTPRMFQTINTVAPTAGSASPTTTSRSSATAPCRAKSRS